MPTSNQTPFPLRHRAIAALAVTAASAMLPTAALAQTSQPGPVPIDSFCADVPEGDRFADVADASAWADAIRCLAHARITQGLDADRYGPSQPVTRAQMASFIARTMDLAAAVDVADRVTPLAAASSGSYPDVDPHSPHIEAILRLTAADIARGGPAGLPDDAFGPDHPVSRDQMASFVVRALEHLTLTDIPAGPDRFPDDAGNAHEEAINTLASLGVVQGYDDGTYRPDATVRRGTMAWYLVRALGHLEAEGVVHPLPVDVPAYQRGFPAQRVSLAHGGATWAVVLAAGADWDDPVLAAAEADARGVGYRTGPTDCDDGAPEALGAPGDAPTVSVYFETEQEARAAAEAFAERGVRAVPAEVTTYCLD